MNLKNIPAQAKQIYYDYPGQFWILMGAMFIDRLGGALLFPFFTLYITRRFNVGMTQVGIIFGLFSLSMVVGGMFSGVLTDRLGRKKMLIFGLVISALSTLVMAMIGRIEVFYLAAIFVGLFSNMGGPAQQAMVADMLPPEKRAEGFGVLRVIINLAVSIGPAIGGLLASWSYLYLFASDAVLSLITAGIVFFTLRETKPQATDDQPQESMRKTFAGYGAVMKNNAFMWFIGAAMLITLIYMQMNTTLSVYLRDVHGVPEQGYGYIISFNAIMVVLLQFPISRRISKYRPLSMMVFGSVLYAIGFGLYGFVSSYLFFFIAMGIITLGEMVTAPTGQALAAGYAPEDMRGRYMAFYGFSWILPSAVGPLIAGMVMDNLNPDIVWIACGIIGFIAAGLFARLLKKDNPPAVSAVVQPVQADEVVA